MKARRVSNKGTNKNPMPTAGDDLMKGSGLVIVLNLLNSINCIVRMAMMKPMIYAPVSPMNILDGSKLYGMKPSSAPHNAKAIRAQPNMIHVEK